MKEKFLKHDGNRGGGKVQKPEVGCITGFYPHLWHNEGDGEWLLFLKLKAFLTKHRCPCGYICQKCVCHTPSANGLNSLSKCTQLGSSKAGVSIQGVCFRVQVLNH